MKCGFSGGPPNSSSYFVSALLCIWNWPYTVRAEAVFGGDRLQALLDGGDALYKHCKFIRQTSHLFAQAFKGQFLVLGPNDCRCDQDCQNDGRDCCDLTFHWGNSCFLVMFQ